ncbi:MAG: sodium:calcium antiporter [Candidatus Omnitrophica bacterium]|nr:sodium:calcium antiporter [Candidatus Omnitrophota bacterium]
MARRKPSFISDLCWVVVAFGLVGQWVVLHLTRAALTPPWEAICPGLGIFGAAFILSWAAELAQLDVPKALAVAFLALIAVLPEYAVDIYFAWNAAVKPEYTAFAAANMTGSNRLLIGLGWPVVLLAFWWATRRREIRLDPTHGIEITTLLVATLYSFLIPLKRTLSLVDTVVLLLLFGYYMRLASQARHEEPELGGPTVHIAMLPRALRRLVTISFFAIAGYTIFIAAEPFAEGLLRTGRHLGIEEFVLVQWLAPLASESPEFIIAVLFALKGDAGASLGTLISSKVNQWTLLIGMLPLAYSVRLGHPGVMHLDIRQVEEIWLTAAQSFFAVAVLANFSFSISEALWLLGLFALQLIWTTTEVRIGFAILYMVLTALLLLARPGRRQATWDLLTGRWRRASHAKHG